MAEVTCTHCNNCVTQQYWTLTLHSLANVPACADWEGRQILVTWNAQRERWEGVGCSSSQPTVLECALRPDWGCYFTAMVMGWVGVDGIECKCVLEAQQRAVADMDCKQGGRLGGIACRCVGDNSWIEVTPA